MMNPTVKKYLKYFLYITVFGLIIWLIYTFLTTASIEIITNNQKNIISIKQTEPQKQSIDIGDVSGNFKTRLSVGTYTVTVKNGYASSQKFFTLGIGDSKKITVNLDDQANSNDTLEIVSNLGAYSTVADENSVKFIDRNINPAKLYSIDSSNTQKNVGSNASFDIISWADTSFGVGLVGSQLQTIKGDVIETIKTPIPTSETTTFTVAPNRDVYISDGQELYLGSGGQNFKKIFTPGDGAQIKIVSASNNTVLLTEKFSDSNREGEIIAFNKKGSKNEIEGEVYEGAWSKTGKYLAVSGDVSAIFDSNLKKIVDLPINNVGALAWVNDNTLVYGEGNLIWSFSVDSQQAAVLATTSGGAGTVSQITASADGSSLYVAIQNPDISNGYSFNLARYKFNSKVVVNPLLQKVSLVLPNTPIDGCEVGYVNFNKLTVTVTSITRIQQLCINSTKTYLEGYDVDPNSLEFQFIPAESF